MKYEPSHRSVWQRTSTFCSADLVQATISLKAKVHYGRCQDTRDLLANQYARHM